MAWHFHIVEIDRDQWACRHGNIEYDHHSSLDAAIEHMRRLAIEHGPASLIVHHRNGTVDHLADSSEEQ